VRRKKRHADGTYSASESYKSGQSDIDLKADNKSGEEGEEEDDSDVSIFSVVSEGGTKTHVQKKRIRDADGNVIGYGEAKPVKAGSEAVRGKYFLSDQANALPTYMYNY
jgi:hypothetical protein